MSFFILLFCFCLELSYGSGHVNLSLFLKTFVVHLPRPRETENHDCPPQPFSPTTFDPEWQQTARSSPQVDTLAPEFHQSRGQQKT